jgi:glycosyltransferase involved in cell wall biosynthesis
VRVGVDATSWSNRRGYGRFARNAVGRLVDLDAGTRYVFFVAAEEEAALELPERAEVRPVRGVRASVDGSSRSSIDLARLTVAASRGGLDAVLFPSVYTYFPVVGVPSVVGLHDIITRQLPELALGGTKDRVLWRLKERVAIKRATVLFTVSKASRRELLQAVPIAAERIVVVPEAPDPAFRPRQRDEAEAAVAKLGLRLDEPLVVYAAGLSPHKNVETLVEAFAAISTPARLVLAGDLDGGPFLSAVSSIRARICELGVEERVVLPGFLSDDELACLYSVAAAAVVPSLAEGFGLPAVEAAACGAATILSDLPAHRETLDGVALFFEPRNRAALTAALERILTEESTRLDVGERGREAVSRLSWDASAEALRDLVSAAANGRGRRA